MICHDAYHDTHELNHEITQTALWLCLLDLSFKTKPGNFSSVGFNLCALERKRRQWQYC